jgi:2-aminoethylphosphonate-pyruvate transaminase
LTSFIRIKALMVKTALLLAAGRGIRMGATGRERPKGFIEIGGETLIVRSIGLLLEHGIERIVAVTGHLSETYDKLAAEYGGRIQCFLNPNFSSSGSLESLRVGLQQVHEPFLLLESDIIYQPAVLDALLKSGEENIVAVSGPTHAGDEVYVWARTSPGFAHSLLLNLSKSRQEQPEEPLGELVGILKIGTKLRSLLDFKASQWQKDDPGASYETGLVAVAQSFPITCMKLAGLIWAEIDDEQMLEHVRRNVYPRLVAKF